MHLATLAEASARKAFPVRNTFGSMPLHFARLTEQTHASAAHGLYDNPSPKAG